MLINISRKNSIVLGLGIIALFFASGIFMLLRSNSELASRALEIEKNAIENTVPGENNQIKPEKPNLSVPVTMNKFERHAMKDGKKAWEIKAERGRYIPAANTAELEDSKLFFYKKDDSKIELIASQSKIIFSGTELSNADLSGGIEIIYNDKVNIKSESAIYSKEDDQITIPGKVLIITDNMELEGTELVAYVSKHEVHINKDVSTIIKPGKK